MITEANDQPADAGVDGQGNAPSDDIDTEAFDRAPAPDDEADAPAASDGEGEEGDGDQDKPKPEDEDPDHEEVEYEGQQYRVPKALKGALMMHADYTRKTQEVGEQRRALETERSTWEQQREESRAALPEEHRKVAILEHRRSALDEEIATYRKVDWETLRQQNPDSYEHHRDRQRSIRDALLDLDEELKGAKSDLQSKEDARLKEQREKADADLAKRRQETAGVLQKEIPGWNGEKAVQTAKFMVENFGIKPEEIAEATDARLWKMAHELMSSRAEIATLKKAQKQKETAENHERAQQTKPAAGAKGAGGGAARDPSTPRGDGLSTEEWMRRRQAQEAAKLRRA